LEDYSPTFSASPNYLLTILLIQVVQSIKEVTLESIATKLAMSVKFESRRKKVQRFLLDDEWDLDNIWLSLVIGWIKESRFLEEVGDIYRK
jgi:hypothetical protein